MEGTKSRWQLNQPTPPLERQMKHLLLTTIAAVLVVGCGESQQSAPAPKTKPIHDAAVFGNIEAVKKHLAAGADVNAKDENGETPLHLAATKETAELLIAEGADVNAKDKDGVTPLDYAKGKKETADLLRKHRAKTGEELKAEGK